MARGRNVPPTLPLAHDDIEPDERTAQARFLRERWESVAALAWESYEIEGCGAVVLRVISAASQGKTEAFYASERAMLAQGMSWPDADTARMVVEYRPEHKIVIAVPHESSGNSTYRMKGSIVPPEARRREREWRRSLIV